MPQLYNRSETQNEITIVYKYHPVFYILLLACFVIAYAGSYAGMSETVAMIIVLCVLSLIIFYHVAIKSVNSEVKKAMRSGNVELSGSKFSFSNPLTVRIKK